MFTTKLLEHRFSNSVFRTLSIALIFAYGSNAFAEAIQSPTKKAAEVNRIIEIDVGKLKAIHADDGRTMYVSENGRYAIVGDFFDMWQRRRITDMDDLARTVRTMDLKGAGFDVQKAVKFSVGLGDQHVTAFVDPNCGWCHRLIKEINQDQNLLDTYTFDFVVVPVLGGQSVRMAQIFSCSTETDETKRLNAFQGGEETILTMPQPASGVCDLSNFQHTASAARQLGITSVPLIIAPDGRFVNGKPQSLESFLLGDETNGGRDLPVQTHLKATIVAPQQVETVSNALQKTSVKDE